MTAVIVICPNCGARYKLNEGLAQAGLGLGGKRMRCAECDHRWTLPEAVEPPLPEPVPEPEVEPVDEPVPEPVPELPAEEEPDDEPRRSFAWIGWLIGVLLLLAAAVLAGGVALERIDPDRVPVVGEWLRPLQPGPSPLVITASGRLTPLPSGTMLLEVEGEVRNTGRSVAGTAVLKATLEAPGGVVRRWSIDVPAAALQPGTSARFTSTLTDVPGGARTLRLVSG
ncbi:MJ0042-type zinc finger domain-containing protein [Polymorphobacter multimanifer]|uniref:MJ0042-type zinc finger domain-containing protein n=1 Tax=Polymorphobacter multimanifer TaxID=1070431 RepID=UPI00166A7553|nr:MJ0042-type zinc finger domain-containing protein [Polymorphobacter multimanifer]